MGPDPRIAEFISANRRRLTREAITAQLREAGYEQEAIDATWAALEARDPDDVAGEGFWGRFWVWLIGMNVAVWLLVGLATQMLPNSIGLAAVLGIALAIGAAISLGLVALTRPDRLGRGAAIAIGAMVPLFFTFLIAGACYALVGAIGPPPPPARSGTMELEIGGPLDFSGTGAAFCQVHDAPTGFSIYAQEGSLGTIDGRPIHASVDSFVHETGPEGGPAPAPAPGTEGGQNISLNISAFPRSEADPPMDWFASPETQLEVDIAPDGLTGTVRFEGLEAAVFEAPPPGEAGFGAAGTPISGEISWACE